LTQDPTGFNAGDPNLYRYVDNSPLDSVDPSGLCEDYRERPTPQGQISDNQDGTYTYYPPGSILSSSPGIVVVPTGGSVLTAAPSFQDPATGQIYVYNESTEAYQPILNQPYQNVPAPSPSLAPENQVTPPTFSPPNGNGDVQNSVASNGDWSYPEIVNFGGVPFALPNVNNFVKSLETSSKVAAEAVENVAMTPLNAAKTAAELVASPFLGAASALGIQPATNAGNAIKNDLMAGANAADRAATAIQNTLLNPAAALNNYTGQALKSYNEGDVVGGTRAIVTAPTNAIVGAAFGEGLGNLAKVGEAPGAAAPVGDLGGESGVPGGSGGGEPGTVTEPTAGAAAEEAPFAPNTTSPPASATGPAIVRVRTGASGELNSAFAKIEPGNIGQGTITNDSSRAFARRLGNPTDDAGHAIGQNLGGLGGVRSGNIFPQAPSVNRGAFNQFEQQIARRVVAGDNVFVRVVPQSSSGSTRPYEVLYQARINGQTISRTFPNP